MSISKNDIKLIKSLDQKKYRHQHQLFKVEGAKAVKEFLNSDYKLKNVFSTGDFQEAEAIKVSEAELAKISALKTPNGVLGVFEIPENIDLELHGLTVVLDDLRDPGNLGTIIRLCDWFGIAQILCSEQTVDCYNPKVVQATMGSLSRVRMHYLNIATFLADQPANIFGTFMDGRSIYDELLSNEGYIVFGNEANGISLQIEELVTRKLSIPAYGNSNSTESLNVATAAAIVINEFRRS